MPSLSALLKRSRNKTKTSDHTKLDEAPGKAQSPIAPKSSKDETKVQRRHSVFRSFLGKSRSEDARSKSPPKAITVPAAVARPLVASSAVDEKPLPPPPSRKGEDDAEPKFDSPESERKPESPASPPLTADALQKLFSGAPQFFSRSEGHHAGPPHPSVAFPWNLELGIRDLTDHAQLEDAAWGCVTSTPHIIRNRPGLRTDLEEQGAVKRAKFVPRCKERPNMLSMQGLERGTVGFQAALELAVADALHDDTKELNAGAIQKIRANFFKNKTRGLRRLDETAVIKRLVEISNNYHEQSPPSRTTVEMYTELFTRLLNPPTRVVDAVDPYSFHVQIEALINVLTIPGIWVDFSNVEWRIRLGQILWGPPFQPDTDEPHKPGSDDVEKPETQRFWLLLQILLSCELVIRLDAVTQNAQFGPKLITLEATRRFEKTCTRPVKWSLLLARIWLENIRIDVPITEVEEPNRKPSSWLASIKSAVAGDHKPHHHTVMGEPEFHGRYQKRQINGLVHFARKLRWPEADSLAAKFASSSEEREASTESSKAPSMGGTPVVGTPLSMTTQRSSYFVGVGRPGIRRGLSQNKLASLFYPAGWLSKSYLSGLILPGEGLAHFLISTLLENDEVAVARLGEDANLYGGFVFCDRSYWSTACIIGRVLAAGKGTSECMNWLASPVKPQGFSEGWVNVQVELEPRSDGQEGPHSARVWKKHLVEQDSYVLGDGDPNSILPQDFTLPPPDVPDPVDLDVKLLQLKLHSGSQDTTPDQIEAPATESTGSANAIRTFSAELVFAIRSEAEEAKEMSLLLSYDVQFVTAHPCVPSIHSRIVAEANAAELGDSPSAIDLKAQLRKPSGPHTLFTGHALHKSYNFSRHTLTSVVYASPTSPPPLLSLHTDSTEVFVIDCTEPSPPHAEVLESHPSESAYVARKRMFGSDLEMLARAWCSEKGYNALISRKGRNCIACSIREARALSWKIVLRFG